MWVKITFIQITLGPLGELKPLCLYVSSACRLEIGRSGQKPRHSTSETQLFVCFCLLFKQQCQWKRIHSVLPVGTCKALVSVPWLLRVMCQPRYRTYNPTITLTTVTCCQSSLCRVSKLTQFSKMSKFS